MNGRLASTLVLVSHAKEWDGANGISEQQTISISNAVSGTFRLALDGATTASIPHNAAASRVASALAALPNVAAPVCAGHELVDEDWDYCYSRIWGSSAMASTYLADNGTTGNDRRARVHT